MRYYQTLRNKWTAHLAQQGKGDTIVEVLIAMLIVSTVLAGAYTATNRSINTERDAQEHSEALSLAQSQLEALRVNNGITGGNCFDSTSELPTSHCNFTASGLNTCTSNGAGYCYDTVISEPTPPTYVISVYWPGLANSNTCDTSNVSTLGNCDQVKLYYHLRIPFANAGNGNNGTLPQGGGGNNGGGGGNNNGGNSGNNNGGGGNSGNGGNGGGPSGNSGNGNADIGDPFSSTCSKPSCAPANSYYDTTNSLSNNSTDPPDTPTVIKQCLWDWGDGTSTTYPGNSYACQPGGWTPLHDYKAYLAAHGINFSVYDPSKCFTVPITPHLTMEFNNGWAPAMSPTNYTFAMPFCW